MYSMGTTPLDPLDMNRLEVIALFDIGVMHPVGKFVPFPFLLCDQEKSLHHRARPAHKETKIFCAGLSI